MTELENGIAVVTGAGRGLGQALAVELARRGRVVAGLGRQENGLAETAETVRGFGGTFLAIRADVADPGSVATAFGAIRKIGPVDILVNNATVHPRRDFLDETMESFMHTVAVNLGGMIGCTREALVDMVRSGSGRILNVTTFADLAPAPTSGAYSVSKGAARIATRALVADLSDRFPGIVINDWVPGLLTTQMGRADGIDTAVAAKWGAELALWLDRSLTGTLWDRDSEVLPPRSLKRRVLDRLLFRKAPSPRRLGLESL